jgi:ubiquinone/menaquinone biosynthesis C-methylase UbiE
MSATGAKSAKSVTTKFIDYPQEIHPERLIALKFLNDNKFRGKTVLDIGCGMKKTVPQIIGVDIRPLADLVCSGDALQFPNNSVDLIISRHSFEHMLNPVKTLWEWIRVLKTNGGICFVLPDHEKINTMLPLYTGPDYEHLHAYTRESFADLIALFPKLRVSDYGTVIENWSFYFIVVKEF